VKSIELRSGGLAHLLAPMVVALLLATAAAAKAPDFEGVWKAAEPSTTLRPADGGEIPLSEQGRRLYEQHKQLAAKADYSFDYTMARCSSPGLPRMMLTNARFRIFQRPSLIGIVFEWNRLYRQIDLRPGSFEKPLVGMMKGATQGRWEGDVLVAESDSFQEKKLLDNLLPNSDELRLLERIRRRDSNTLEDRITITDPQMYTRPWDVVLVYKRQSDSEYPFPEDVCLDRHDAGQPAWPR
jgi:hypothetical protein